MSFHLLVVVPIFILLQNHVQFLYSHIFMYFLIFASYFFLLFYLSFYFLQLNFSCFYCKIKVFTGLIINFIFVLQVANIVITDSGCFIIRWLLINKHIACFREVYNSQHILFCLEIIVFKLLCFYYELECIVQL